MKVRVCKRCKKPVESTETPGYSYYCPKHDEDLYEFETEIVEGILLRGTKRERLPHLKPCPFCGGDAFVAQSTNENCLGELYDTFIVICEKCTAEAGIHDTKEQAINTWNTRPAEDALKAEVEDWYFVLEAELWASRAMEGLPAEWIRFPKKLHSMEEVVREAIRVFHNATSAVSTIRVSKEWTEEIFTAKSVEELNSRAWESIDVLKQEQT
jgi:Lar family restriction alleviation protein